MIEASDLTKRYPTGTLALDALNLRVETGEIYCLLGAKGAGKTTAVNLFLGFQTATAGRARIAGIDVQEEPLRAKTQVAYLADTTAFYPRLTLLQNLRFFARLGGRRGSSLRDCEMALREVGIPELDFHRRVSELDPGEIRKLGLAAAILKEAPALLLDEPLSGLDPKAPRRWSSSWPSRRSRARPSSSPCRTSSGRASWAIASAFSRRGARC